MTHYQELAVIILAFAIGIAYLIKLRSYDAYQREPFKKLLLVMVLGGAISVLASLFLYKFVNVRYNIIDAIFKIGFIEEVSKLLALAIALDFIKREFDEIVDGLIYISAVSLGFSVIENVFYCFSAEAPFTLLITRSIFATVGHMSFSGYMGIAFFIHKKIHKNYLGLFLSVALASLAHGLYDGFLFHQNFANYFYLLYIGLVFLQLWFLRIALSYSAFRKSMSQKIFEPTNRKVEMDCLTCKGKVNCNELVFGNIVAGHCETCNSFIFRKKYISRLFKYFRPLFRVRKYYRIIPRKNRTIVLDKEKTILLNPKTKILCAPIHTLSDWLNENNEKDKQKILRIPIIGVTLKYLGVRYLAKK